MARDPIDRLFVGGVLENMKLTLMVPVGLFVVVTMLLGRTTRLIGSGWPGLPH